MYKSCKRGIVFGQMEQKHVYFGQKRIKCRMEVLIDADKKKKARFITKCASTTNLT